MKRCVFVVSVVFFWMFSFANTQGQSGNLEGFSVNYLEEDNGLIFKETVYAILEDSRGVIWIATGNGVWLYDGHEVEPFKSESGTLLSAQIKEIVEDKNGDIWIATIGGGLGYYNWEHDRLTNIVNEENETPLQSNDINTIALDKNNNLWIGYRWGGVDFLDTRSHNVSTVIPKNSETYDVSELEITDKFVFIGTWRAGIFKLDLHSYEIERIDLGEGNHDKASPITSLYVDKTGAIWLGDRSANLFKLNEKGALQNQYLCKQIGSNVTPHINDIISLEKQLYLITSAGVYLKSLDDDSPPFLLKDNKLTQLLISTSCDEFDNLWIGTSSGLLRLSPNRFQLTRYKWNHKLNFTSIEKSGEGHVFLGTWNNGLFFKKNDNQQNFADFSEIEKLELDSKLQIYCLADIETGLLIGLKDYGLVFYDYTSKAFNKEWSSELRNMSVIKVLPIDKEHILVGTLEGLFLVDASGKLLMYLYQSGDKKTAISDIQVTDVIKTTDQDIWVGTALSGLFKITFHKDFKEYSTLNFTHSRVDPKSLSEDYVTAIYEDADGGIWVGTRNNGVNKLNDEQTGFQRYSQENGLAKARTVAFIEDSAMRLWVLGESSASRYMPDNDAFIGYHQEERGESINRFCCPGANIIGAYNQLLIGSTNGLVMFNPFKTFQNKAPKVFIDDFSLVIADKMEHETYYSTEGNKPIWSTQKITLHENVKSITFELKSPNLSDSKSTIFAYKLEGYDDDWMMVSSERRFVDYSNIPSGNYDFLYKAIDRKGLESTTASIKIVQLAPFWLTNWAYALYACLALFIFYLARKAVLYKISLEQKVEIERVVRNKEKEVHELRLKLFTDISHELRTPLTLVMGPLERLVGRSKRLGNTEVADDLLTVQRNASKILEMIQNVMNVNRPENYRSSYHPTINDIVDFTGNLAKQYIYLAEKRQIKFTFASFLNDYELNFDKDKLDRVLTNLLSNAFKYAPKNETIIIEIFKKQPHSIPGQLLQKSEGGYIEIGVYNSGSFIPQEEADELFNRFYRGSEAEQNQAGYGIGLSIVKELVEVQHGKVYHNSAKGIGTYFGVSLPTFVEAKELEGVEEQGNYVENILHDPNQAIQVHVEDIDSELPTLVIIEDDKDLLNFIKSIFSKHFKVFIFSNGQEGLNFVFDEMPDIVICDLMLPAKNGFEICEEIKKDIRTCHIPVIILTALGTREKELEGIEYGADAFIAKPFSTKYLLTKTKSVLKNRESVYKKVPTEFILEPKNNSKNSADKKFLDKLNQEILNNISNSELKIEELSQKFHLSRVHFFRRIKEITGMSPTEYKRNVRLKQASIKLLEGNENISQIAYSHGFSTPNYFSICFKKQFGVTPKEYMENAKLNESTKLKIS